jgi:XTP/dITP diphosphohydrolase
MKKLFPGNFCPASVVLKGKCLMELVLATRNSKKVEEIRRILADFPISICTLDDFPGCPEVEEDGATFEENAVKKATAVARCTGKPALADDSGLEVAALDGAPGTLSARYAGEPADDRRNIERLLRAMHGINKRGARFVCCIAFAVPDEGADVFYGYVNGHIGKEPRGSQGFGYDPVFYPTGSDHTFAEMSDEDKDAVSHRRRALDAFRKFIEQWIYREKPAKRADENGTINR